MRNEASVLILQDRSTGLESCLDDLRRVQIFASFSYAANQEELVACLTRKRPDVILLAYQCFPTSLEQVAWQIYQSGLEIPIIVAAEHVSDLNGMDLLRKGAQDWIEFCDISKLGASIYRAMREHGRSKESVVPVVPVQQKALTPSVRSMEVLIESLVDIVTEVDMLGTILYESPSVTPVFGWLPEEVVGKSAFALMHPLDIPKVMPVFMVALTNPGTPYSVRFRWKHKDGGWRLLECVGKSIIADDGSRRIIVTSREITDQKRKLVLGDSESHFKTVIEALGEGVLLTDASDKILYANKRIAELTGYAVNELLGQKSYELFLPEPAWDIFRAQKQKWMNGDSSTYELAIAKKNGSELCTHVNVTPYRNDEGVITGTLTAFIDMTQRKEAEEEVQRAFQVLEKRVEERTADLQLAQAQLEQSHALLETRVKERTQELVNANKELEHEIRERLVIESELRSAKDRAEEMNRLKTSFLANISHEIRTPMTSILGFASILSESLEGNELSEFSGMIEKSGRRLLETMSSILDLARVDANKVEFSPSIISIDEEVNRVLHMLQPQLREKSLTAFVHSSERIEGSFDPHYFARILINLIGNAIKFTSSGSVSVGIEREKEGYVKISIADTGIGISKDFLPHIFDEFKQESSGWSRNYEGTGLGLTISKRLVDLMGGTIRVESEKGKGSCFSFIVPLGAQNRSQAHVIATPGSIPDLRRAIAR